MIEPIIRYPHLLPGEVLIWERFLGAYGMQYQEFLYDIHVGKSPVVVEPLPPEIRRVAETVISGE